MGEKNVSKERGGGTRPECLSDPENLNVMINFMEQNLEDG